MKAIAEVIDPAVRQVYGPMLPKFKRLLEKNPEASDVELFWLFEREYGDWFEQKACPALGIDDGACIVDAICLAQEALGC